MLTAVVIPFPKRPASERRTAPSVNGPAQIIIYPGVRYSRMPEQEDLFAIATAPLRIPAKRK